jgi:hypothetical protein
MRRYIRHPFQIPLRIHAVSPENEEISHTKNVTAYGMCFSSPEKLNTDSIIELSIPSINPNMKMRGHVVWCEKEGDRYDIGVKFVDRENEYRARMIEQICHIKEYKQTTRNKAGRILSDSEAAREWIDKFATDFPK